MSWDKKAKKWVAKITVGGKSKSLGYFAGKDDAGRAYDAAIRKYYPNEKPQKWTGYSFTAAEGGGGQRRRRRRGVCARRLEQ